MGYGLSVDRRLLPPAAGHVEAVDARGVAADLRLVANLEAPIDRRTCRNDTTYDGPKVVVTARFSP